MKKSSIDDDSNEYTPAVDGIPGFEKDAFVLEQLLGWDNESNLAAKQVILASLEDSDNDDDAILKANCIAETHEVEVTARTEEDTAQDDADAATVCTIIEQTKESMVISDGKDISICVTKDMLAQWETMLQENYDNAQESSDAPMSKNT